MEKKKINFSDIKGMLSKDQMKSIKGGSAGDPGCGTSCTVYLNGGGQTGGVCGTWDNQCACFSSVSPGYQQFGTQTGCHPQ
ncbi:hypothetical protein [Mucilaginibacter sp. L196]|uniref:hypothetical protein n=1 Tax=Mucilaginibacter sp. L196 TaxID=1641870 RepID=UPI00131B1442|nr:hypothetical protein [Mucilaginibacter sp. L196]